MANRIVEGIARAETAISKVIDKDGTLERTNRSLDLSFPEFVKFQEIKSIAQLNETITLDEAQTVYEYLGRTPEHFNRQPLAVKYTLTCLFKELLALSVAARQKAN